ncbi:unnamed protein product [Lupinus luteus]|uniref:Uncharacterized protein n=1 Tax=Lupinus luteus TaxID=3873 RepID=A0AAV1XMW9_LUPLU
MNSSLLEAEERPSTTEDSLMFIQEVTSVRAELVEAKAQVVVLVEEKTTLRFFSGKFLMDSFINAKEQIELVHPDEDLLGLL